MSATSPAGSGSSGSRLASTLGEADRLGAQLLADGRVAGRGRVALVEDQVEHRHHLVEPLRDDRLGRLAKADAGDAQPPLRAHQPLRHDGLRDEEGARDLGRREAAGQPQRERDLRLGRERRVAAGEDQLEAVVGQAVVGEVRGGLRRPAARAAAASTPASGRAGAGRAPRCRPSRSPRRPARRGRPRPASGRRRA